MLATSNKTVMKPGLYTLSTTRSGHRLGKLWLVGDLSVKVKCSVHSESHPECSLFIDVFARNGRQLRSASDVLKKMVEWLAMANALGPEQHKNEANAIKLALGMNLRRKKE